MSRFTAIAGIRHPVIQAGMVWVSGWRLATAISDAGGLGLIGAGSMKPDLLEEHIRKALSATTAPLGVNIPLLRGDAAELVETSINGGLRIVFTSAGHPGKFIGRLKEAGCIVVHVVSSVKQAVKAEQAGCDAIVAEGFEAGGHNGMDESTTLCLVPQVVDAVSIPVLAAGGIADGRGMLAAMALGADAVQIGTRFAATVESSAHETYKRLVVESGDAGTVLALRSLAPVRLIKTPFAARALEAERRGAGHEELRALLGSKRERAGIFEGDVEEGEFEAGQSAGLIHDIPTAREAMERLLREYEDARARLYSIH
ncbi:MAG: nitronate monooxygenase [Ignavibacteriae bacterium]|nr:nitronate monooxygenase [Ignavibacteriota bacterium]